MRGSFRVFLADNSAGSIIVQVQTGLVHEEFPYETLSLSSQNVALLLGGSGRCAPSSIECSEIGHALAKM